MEVRHSIRHGLISSSYPASIRIEVTIGSLAFASSFPLSGGFETHPLETYAARHTAEKRLKTNFNLFLKHYLN